MVCDEGANKQTTNKSRLSQNTNKPSLFNSLQWNGQNGSNRKSWKEKDPCCMFCIVSCPKGHPPTTEVMLSLSPDQSGLRIKQRNILQKIHITATCVAIWAGMLSSTDPPSTVCQAAPSCTFTSRHNLENQQLQPVWCVLHIRYYFNIYRNRTVE